MVSSLAITRSSASNAVGVGIAINWKNMGIARWLDADIKYQVYSPYFANHKKNPNSDMITKYMEVILS